MSRVLEVDITVAGEPSETEGLTRGSRDDDSGVLSRRFARRHGLHLLGAAACWFVLDVVVVGRAPDLRRRRTLVLVLRTSNGQRQEDLVLPKNRAAFLYIAGD
jgi:hypothetical protein